MRKIYIFVLLVSILKLRAQNCETFRFSGDSLQYEACKIAEEASDYYQFSKEYQEVYDRALEKCDYFATGYHAKSVAYLKSGDFIEWKRLIDKAVALKPKEFLSNRGWCLFEFCKDYGGAIQDIERLDELVDYDIGYSSDGAYHLNIVKAVCYKQIGEGDKAIEIFEAKLNEENYSAGPYDYLHYGVTLLENGDAIKAISMIEKQIEINESAECYYYLALAFKKQSKNSKYKSNLQKAKELYQKGNFISGSYVSHIDKVYLQDIEDEINSY